MSSSYSPQISNPASQLIAATNNVLNKSGATIGATPLQTTAMIGNIPVPITTATPLSTPLERLQKVESTVPSPGSIGGLTPIASSSPIVSSPVSGTGATLVSSPIRRSPRQSSRKKTTIDYPTVPLMSSPISSVVSSASPPSPRSLSPLFTSPSLPSPRSVLPPITPVLASPPSPRSGIPLTPISASPRPVLQPQSSFENIQLNSPVVYSSSVVSPISQVKASLMPAASPLASASVVSPSLKEATLVGYSSPSPNRPSLIAVIKTDPSLTTLNAAITAAGLEETLSGIGPYTIFAPTNDAFSMIDRGNLSKLLADKQKLSEVLTYHVLLPSINFNEFPNGNIRTLNGQPILIQRTENGIKINNEVNIIGPDITASNGVIHKIDKVLMPGSDTFAVQLSPKTYNVVSPKLLSPKIMSPVLPVVPTMSRIATATDILQSSQSQIQAASPISSVEKPLNPAVDEVLFEKGYVIINVVQMGGTGEVSFVQAFNRKGDICYIKINKWGSISFDLKDRSVVTVSPASTIAHSMKVSTMECAKNASCGVFFQCEGEMCYVNRDQEGKMEDTSFVSVTKPSDSLMTQVGSPVAYPVITFTEIEQDNENAVKRVRLATVAIQKQATKVNLEQLDNLCKEAYYLAECIDKMKIAAAKMYEFRFAETNRYLKLANSYDEMAAQKELSAINQEKRKEVVSRLSNLSNVNTQLLGFTDESSRIIKEHIKTSDIISSDVYYSMFTEARKNFSGDVSRNLLKAEVWNLPVQMDRVDMKKSHANYYVDSSDNIVEVPLTKSVEKLNHSLGMQ